MSSTQCTPLNDDRTEGDQAGGGVHKAVELHRQRVEKMRVTRRELWGDRPLPTTDAATSWVDQMFFVWVRPYMDLAAAEQLTTSNLPPPATYYSAFNVGRLLSDDWERRFERRWAWEPLIGVGVRHRDDDKSSGILRWVGYPQVERSNVLKVGVEWTVPYATCGERHDGAVGNERLFMAHPDSATVEEMGNIVFIATPDQLPEASIRPTKPGVGASFISALTGLLAWQLPPKLVSDTCTMFSPVLLEYFVKYLQTGEPSDWLYGLGLACSFFLINFCSSMMSHQYFHICLRSGATMRSAILGLIFEKILTVASKPLAHPELSTGRIVNMISTDVERIDEFNWYAMYAITAPIQLVVAVGLLYRLVGWVAFAGLGAIVFTMPAQALVLRYQSRYRERLSKATDERVKATNELFSGVRIVKFMCWEPRFIDKVLACREVELGHLKSTQYCRILSALINVAAPTFIMATVFVLYHATGHQLTPVIVFPTIALLAILRMPFMLTPVALTSIVQLQVALVRIRRFLEAEDDVLQTEPLPPNHPSAVVATGVDATAFLPKLIDVPPPTPGCCSKLLCCCRPRQKPQLQHADERSTLISKSQVSAPGADNQKRPPGAGVPKDDSKLYQLDSRVLIKNVTFAIPRGGLTVIIGPTGSGKTTLLETILGQLVISRGSMKVQGSTAYVPQTPWIMNTTVRNNVVFFDKDDPEKLSSAIRSCQLGPDIDSFAGGLETEIGEKGVNLSGGQKSRLALARAVYSDRDVYLLDDPLSALDVHVGERIVDECINGILTKKTRVLATHHIWVIPKAEYVIVLASEGRIEFAGSAQEYADFEAMKRLRSSEMTASLSSPVEAPESNGDVPPPLVPSEKHESELTQKTKKEPAAKLMTVEEKASGSVSWQMYMTYFESCGGKPWIAGILLVFAVTEVINASVQVWLSLWSVREFGLAANDYLYVYLGVVVLSTMSNPVRVWLVYHAMRAGSRRLHEWMLRSVCTAPMSFFDTTPLGRILNRFSRDIDQIDNDLQMSYISLLMMLFSLLSTVLVMLVSQPFVIIAIIPCTVVYYRVLRFYNMANRDVKRISNIVKSPMYSLMTEAIGGMKPIRAANKGAQMMKEALKRLDTIYSSSYTQNICNRWYSIRIEFVGNIVVTSVALSCVVSKTLGYHANVGLMSLSLTLASEITSTLKYVVKELANVESKMNSVERVSFYGNSIPREDAPELIDPHYVPQKTEATPGPEASIVFKDVCLRYRDGLPLVLRDVNFIIKPGDRVGIVGRTGSGKSTLLLAFLRILDLASGEMIVCGRPTRDYTLRQLRQLFAMVPQDPLLFDGTITSNLNPFGLRTDDEVWRALAMVGMAERIRQEEGGLEAVVMDGGSNFSVGQRQLLCMARALLQRNSKFLLMDEATANVDPVMDKQIQDTVRSAFKHQTVVTIAHRLNTVLDYTKIIVMENGSVLEVGSPRELALERPASAFRALIASQGPAQERALLKILRKGHWEAPEDDNDE